MAKIWDWFRNDQSISLDLKRTQAQAHSQLTVPKAPPIELSSWSLNKYLRNSQIVYACIEKKAQAATDPELIVERLAADGEYEAVENHPAIALMTKPNPFDDLESFMRAWVASDNIAGVFYAEIVRSRAGVPVELYPLLPLNVFPQYRGDVLTHYEYWVDGRCISYLPEDLLIYRRHPLGSMYAGVSPLIVALGAIDADVAATEFVRGFFDNGGSPSGIINFKDRSLTEEEMTMYQQRWRSKYGRGGSDRGGVAVFDKAQVEYTAVGSNLDELNSDTQTSINEARICMVFGVPPILIGAYVGLLHVNQRASVREAQQDFWMNTMSPDLKTKRKFLDMFLLSLFEDEQLIRSKQIRFNWDMSQVSALQDDLDSMVTRAAGAYKGGIISRNEARGMIGYDPLEEGDERGDEFFKPTPALNAANGGDDEERSDDPAAKSADAIIEASLLLPSADLDGIEKKTVKNGDYSREMTSLEALINVKKLEDDVEKGSQRLNAILLALRTSLIEQAAKEYAEMGGDDLSELSITPPADIYTKIRKVLVTAFQNGQFQVIDELRKQGLELDATAVAAIKQTYEQMELVMDITVSTAVSEVRGRAIDRIASLSLTGSTKEEIGARLIDDLVDESIAWVNEASSAAVNRSMQDGREEEFKELAEFITVYVYSGILDKRICPECKQWDGKIVENRDELPQTPNPGCHGRHRCRCFVIAVHESNDFVADGNEVR